MGIEHINNERQNDNEFPFAYLPSKDTETQQEKTIGKGFESQVKMLGPDWVVKEVNPFNSKGGKRTQEFVDYLRSSDRVKQMMQDQNKLANIFGVDHFAKTQVIYGKDQNGTEGYMFVQKFIPGTALSNLIGNEYKNTKELIEQNREQFMEIVWAAKKSFIEFGIPFDFHLENLMRNDNNKNIVVMDAGIPTEEYEIIKNKNITERTKNVFEHAYKRIERISRYERFLQLTPQEKSELDGKYNISNEEYQKRIQDIGQMRLEKGITLDPEETASERFLKKALGEKEVITGQALYEYALGLIATQQPTESQNALLEKIKKQSATEGNLEYWKQLIESEGNN